MIDGLLENLGNNYGLLGILLALSLIALYFKDKEVRDVRKEVSQKNQDFINYLLQTTSKDGELKQQLLTFMQTISALLQQAKK